MPAHLQRQLPRAACTAMTQFHVSQADRELQIYASPVNIDPRDPPIPISQARRLLGASSRRRSASTAPSAGRSRRTSRSTRGALDEAAFLYDSDRAFDDREKIILESLKRDDWDLFVAAIETTDRVSHMMWRLIDPKHPMYDKELAAKYGDSIEKVYRRADDFVGRLRQKVPKDAVFMVMSDHGFHSFRREVNLNTWLVQNGYMVVRRPGGTEKGLARPLRPRQVLRGRRLVADPGLRGGPRPDLLQPPGPRGPGHRLRGAGVPRAAGRDPRRSSCRSPTPTTGERIFRRRLQARRHLQGRVPPDRARPAGGLQRRLPRGLAGHPGRRSAGRWSRTTTGSGAATTAPPPPRSADGVFFCNRKIANRDAAHHGPRPLDPEAARGRGPRRLRRQAPLVSDRPPAARPRRGAAGGAGGGRSPGGDGRRGAAAQGPGAARRPGAGARPAARPGEEPPRRGRAAGARAAAAHRGAAPRSRSP